VDILEAKDPLKFRQVLNCPKCVESTKMVFRVPNPIDFFMGEPVEEGWECPKCGEVSGYKKWLEASGLKECECE
jgi:uncharacterized C2H2 Zn-finger protein